MSCTPNADILAQAAVIEEQRVERYLHPVAASKAEVMCRKVLCHLLMATGLLMLVLHLQRRVCGSDGQIFNHVA